VIVKTKRVPFICSDDEGRTAKIQKALQQEQPHHTGEIVLEEKEATVQEK